MEEKVHYKNAHQKGPKRGMEKSSVTEKMMVMDTKEKSDGIHIRNNGASYGDGPKPGRNILGSKSHSCGHGDYRMGNNRRHVTSPFFQIFTAIEKFRPLSP
jgi:hypothetical protein